MLLFFLLLVAVGVILELRSTRRPLDGVTYRRQASPRVVEPEQPFELVTEISNRSKRFLPFVRVSEELPSEITVVQTGVRLRVGVGDAPHVENTVYLLPRQRWTRRLSVTLPARGRYLLRGASLAGGDFLGLNENGTSFAQVTEIVVLPLRRTDDRALRALGGFLGDVSVNRFILEDPVLTLGFRDYTGHEPQKSISWAQSARMGRLMVKNYDHTLELSMSVILNVEGGTGEEFCERAEQCFSLARAVCEELERRKISYRFFSNAGTLGAVGYWTRIGEGMGAGHLGAILEGLGRAAAESIEPFDRIIAQAAHIAEPGRCHVVLTPVITPAVRAGARLLHDRTGGAVLLISPDEEVRL